MARLIACLAGIVLFGVTAGVAQAAVFRVNTQIDSVDVRPGDGRCSDAGRRCSLRAAVEEANALAGANAILVPPGDYRLTLHGAGEDLAATGDLDIAKRPPLVRSRPAPPLLACREGASPSLIIAGAGHATRIDGDGADRVFDIHTGNTAQLLNMEVVNGNSVYGGGIAVEPAACLNATRLTVARNRSTGTGGGVFSGQDSDLNMTDSAVIDNHAISDGGGLEFVSAAFSEPYVRQLTNVTVSGNSSESTGGGIDNFGHDTLLVTNVTVAGNYAPLDSAVDFLSDGTCVLPCTGASSPFGSMDVRNSIFVGTCSGAGLSSGGRLLSGGHNIESGNTCGFTLPTDRQNTDPLLGPLGWLGGETPILPLTADSPAIDDADPTTCPSQDQRGQPRVNTCDTGAFEYQLKNPGG